MKKILPPVNLILLVVNIVLFIFFTVYTVMGTNPFGSYMTDSFIQIQLVIALIYEFLFFIESIIISKVLKKDLSYKGVDVLELVPKPVFAVFVVLGLVLVIVTAVLKISAEFAVMEIFMLFSILLEIGITKLFFKSKQSK